MATKKKSTTKKSAPRHCGFDAPAIGPGTPNPGWKVVHLPDGTTTLKRTGTGKKTTKKK